MAPHHQPTTQSKTVSVPPWTLHMRQPSQPPSGGKNLTSTLATASASLLPQAKNFTLRSNASCRMKSGASRWFAESQTNTPGRAVRALAPHHQPTRFANPSAPTTTVRRMYREARSVVNQGGGEGVDLCPRLSRRPLICRRDCPRDAARY